MRQTVLATLTAVVLAVGSVTADEIRSSQPKAAGVRLSASQPPAGSSVQARPSREEQRRVGMIKIMSGLGLAAVGVVMAANSGASATIQDPYFRGTTKISVRSNGRLYGGLGLVGAGGVLIYLGAKDRSAATPNPSLAFEVGPRTRVVFQKSW